MPNPFNPNPQVQLQVGRIEQLTGVEANVIDTIRAAQSRKRHEAAAQDEIEDLYNELGVALAAKDWRGVEEVQRKMYGMLR